MLQDSAQQNKAGQDIRKSHAFMGSTKINLTETENGMVYSETKEGREAKGS